MSARVEPDRDVSLQGRYAGFVTRFAAFAVDVVTVALTYTLGVYVVEALIHLMLDDTFMFSDHPTISAIILVAWAFLYAAYPLAVSGRTFGMAVLGLRAVRRDGRPLDGRHAVVRVLTFPLSFLLLGFGFLLILLRRDRRALHDLFGDSAVVYGWDARAARLRFLAKRPTSAVASATPSSTLHSGD